MGDTLGCIDQEQGDVCPLQRFAGTQHRIEVGIFCDLGFAAYPGRVYQPVAAPVEFNVDIDRVTRCPGSRGDDDPALANQLVQESRLADVGAADDGHPRNVVLALDIRLLWKRPDDPVQELAHSPAVVGTDGMGLTKAETPETIDVAFQCLVVEFVGGEHHRDLRRPENRDDAGVVVGELGSAVDHEDDGVRTRHRRLGLFPDRDADLVRRLQLPATGVDKHEIAAGPIAVELTAITGDAGELLDYRRSRTDDPVDQGRLAHIGTTHDDDDGKSAHCPGFKTRCSSADDVEGFSGSPLAVSLQPAVFALMAGRDTGLDQVLECGDERAELRRQWKVLLLLDRRPQLESRYRGETIDDLLHEVIGRRGPGGEPDYRHVFQPTRVDVIGRIDAVCRHPVVTLPP